MRYTTPVYTAVQGYTQQGRLPSQDRFVVTGSSEQVGVPVPAGNKVLPSAGHWRTNERRAPQPKPRLQPRPTGGAVARTPAGNPVAKRAKRRPNAAPASKVHAQWAKGKLY